ncbi:hypothetical protein GO755_39320 [Spirosoma sp. HMF4905]|uniref:Uncharacterized protein n=1 Tax=Spirosoma arboris TaxID=2682092 RepID=A0A7K1SQR5_9BACT|nr:hypothetical protein [Spirosoma arboris]MVM36129.1 hypothetical protein [Spirosoma arboris]
MDSKATFSNAFGPQKDIEAGLLSLKNIGLSQADSIKLLIQVLNISLSEADKIVLNSATWKDYKNDTISLREAIYETWKDLQ